MSLSDTEQKYINKTLADLLDRALSYRSKVEKGRGNTRDKAIWAALYIDAMRAYNFTLTNLSFLGTNTLARAQKPISDRWLRENGYDLVTEDDMEYIVGQAYGISKIERQTQRYEFQKKQAQAFISIQGSPKKVQEAIETLIKHGAIDKLIPLEQLLENKKAWTASRLPRGNPAKGGYVKKYLSKGKTLDEADRLAELDCETDRLANTVLDEQTEQQQIILDEEMQAAIDKLNKEEGTVAHNRERERNKRLFDILEMEMPEPIVNIQTIPEQSEPVIKTKTPSLADLNPLAGGDDFK